MTTRISNSKFLTILDPLPIEGIGWEAVALHVDNSGASTVMQRVFRAVQMQGSKVRNDYGSGRVLLPKDDVLWGETLPSPLAGINPLDREFVWQLYEDGILRHEFFGEDIEEDIAISKESPRRVSISGRTTEVALAWGVHVPAWAEVQTITLSDTADAGSFRLKYGSQSSTSIAYNSSASSFKSAVLAGISLLSSADLEVTKTIENNQVLWRVRFVGQFIDGNVVAKGFRIGSSNVTAGGNDSEPSASDITQEDFYADPDPRPAITAFLDVLQRCQDRDILPFLTPLFDEDEDSFGEPWLDNTEITVNPGETLLSLLQRFSEAFDWEFRMLPGFQLQVVQGGFGVNVSDNICFWIGGHQIDHSLARTSREMVSRVWAQTQKNEIVSDTGSNSSSDIQREIWIDGFEGSSSYAQQVATTTRRERDRQARQRQATFPYNIDDQHRLFTDFTYCDLVGVEDDRNVMHIVKVRSVSWTVNDEFPIDFEVTFLGE